MSGNQRILKVVNNSQYPMELAHPDLSVASQGGLQGILYDAQNLLNNYGGSYTIAQPGEQVTYDVNMPVNTIGGVQTAADLFGEDIYALDVGLSSLANIVTALDLAEVEGGVKLFDRVVTFGSCGSSLVRGATAVLSNCFGAAALAQIFGDTLGVVLSAVVAYTSVVQFFRSEVDVSRDMLTGKDNYTVAITHKAVGGGTVSPAPVTGTSAPPSQEQPVPQGSGRTDISPCLNLRSGPNGSTTLIGCIPDNTVMPIACTVQGDAVTGPWDTTTIWDKVTYGGTTGYVSDAYVYTGTNSSAAVACATAPAPPAALPTGTIRISPCLNLRSGPNGSTTLIGCIPEDTVISIECTAQGDAVTGPWDTTTIWDRTTYGGTTGYVSDAYVYTGTNSAVAPAC
jgi:hypothetical protein